MLSSNMNRYHAQKAAEGWSILDGQTRRILAPVEAGPSKAGANALSDLLNTLDGRPGWRKDQRPAVTA